MLKHTHTHTPDRVRWQERAQMWMFHLAIARMWWARGRWCLLGPADAQMNASRSVAEKREKKH